MLIYEERKPGHQAMWVEASKSGMEEASRTSCNTIIDSDIVDLPQGVYEVAGILHCIRTCAWASRLRVFLHESLIKTFWNHA